MSSMDEDDEWELDSDEIRSISSEELYETRPNRWRGPPSTWRAFTKEETTLYRSLEQARNQDLAVHLYNAFALKHLKPPRDDGRGAPESLDEIVNSSDWQPPQKWTLWPLPTNRVPKARLLQETHDEHDDETLRQKTNDPPSRELEEEISAAILKFAKERFLQREESDSESEDGSSEDSDVPGVKQEAVSEDGDRDETATTTTTTRRRRRGRGDTSDSDFEGRTIVVRSLSGDESDAEPEEREYVPVFSADDDLSSELLRPTVRHILSKVDATLTTLHNARMACLVTWNMNRSSRAEMSPDSVDSDRVRPLRKLRSIPLRGKMPLRDKKQKKKRISASSSPESSDSDSDASMSASPGRTESLRTSKLQRKEQLIGRWAPRDWRDVIGAAALSGFQPDVVARAAQRCADLFGESMELVTLHEGAEGQVRTQYRPGMGADASAAAVEHGGTSEEGAHLEVVRRRLRLKAKERRQADRAKAMRNAYSLSGRGHPRDSDESEGEEESANAGNDEPRLEPGKVEPAEDGLYHCPVVGCRRHTKGFPVKRGLMEHFRATHSSRSQAKGIFYCPWAECVYHLKSLKTKKILNVHMKNMHDGVAPRESTGLEENAAAEGEGQDRSMTETGLMGVDSEDEMDGAVHVDGFLKPIRIRRGWLAKGGASKGRLKKRKRASS